MSEERTNLIELAAYERPRAVYPAECRAPAGPGEVVYYTALRKPDKALKSVEALRFAGTKRAKGAGTLPVVLFHDGILKCAIRLPEVLSAAAVELGMLPRDVEAYGQTLVKEGFPAIDVEVAEKAAWTPEDVKQFGMTCSDARPGTFFRVKDANHDFSLAGVTAAEALWALVNSGAIPAPPSCWFVRIWEVLQRDKVNPLHPSEAGKPYPSDVTGELEFVECRKVALKDNDCESAVPFMRRAICFTPLLTLEQISAVMRLKDRPSLEFALNLRWTSIIVLTLLAANLLPPMPEKNRKDLEMRAQESLRQISARWLDPELRLERCASSAFFNTRIDGCPLAFNLETVSGPCAVSAGLIIGMLADASDKQFIEPLPKWWIEAALTAVEDFKNRDVMLMLRRT